MGKKMLPTRLEIDVITRLNRTANSRKISVNDAISLALDGLEGEREVAQTITDRIEFLEKNLGSLIELLKNFDKKMDLHFTKAGASEQERLGALYRLLELRLKEHDTAERERFQQMVPRFQQMVPHVF